MNQLAVETTNSVDIGANLGYTIIAVFICLAVCAVSWARNRPGSPESIRAEAALERAKHKSILDKVDPNEQ